MNEISTSPMVASRTTRSHGSLATKHSWSAHERLALRILIDGYNINWAEAVPIFNGFLNPIEGRGIKRRVLYAQYNNITRKSTRLRKKQLNASYPTSKAAEENIRKALEATARKLGIELIRCNANLVPNGANSPEDADVSTTRQQVPKSSTDDPKQSSPLGTSIPRTTVESSQPKIQCRMDRPKTPSIFANSRYHSGLLTPPPSRRVLRNTSRSIVSERISPLEASNCWRKQSFETSIGQHLDQEKDKQLSVNELPLIGFRGFSPSKTQGYNSADGFRSGRFVHSARIEQCPAIESEEFRSTANEHVGWRKLRPSPWISITTSLIRAMMRARSPQSGRFLAVIDLRKVDESGYIFSTKTLNLKPTKADGSKIKYQSGGEYIVWGAIPKFAILSVMAVEDIANIPPSVPNDPDPFLIGFITTAWRRTATRCEISKNGPLMLSYFGGHAVGQLVRRIRLPDAYLDAAVTCIVTDWSFKTRKFELWQENTIFCEGLKMGLEDRAPASLDTGRGEMNIYSTRDDASEIVFLQQLELAAAGSADDEYENRREITTRESIDKVDRMMNEVGQAESGGEKNESEDYILANEEALDNATKGDLGTREQGGDADCWICESTTSEVTNDPEPYVYNPPIEDHPFWTGM